MAAIFDRLTAATPPQAPEILFGTACVIGGSIAGLLAARVLADHAEHVVVVERDERDNPAQARSSVPQRQHLHVLIPGGHAWIDRWLPGYTQEMRDGGALLVAAGQFGWYQDDWRMPQTVHPRLAASRTFLEDTVRARVLGLPNVSVLHGSATDLLYQGDEVRGVRWTPASGTPDEIEAGFVVDASGRASKLPDWLAAGGFDRPALQRLAAPINYTTAVFKRHQSARELPTSLVLVQKSPPFAANDVAIAALSAIENDQWMVTLIGYDDARPGRTLEEFRAECATLPPLFAEASAGELTDDIATYRQAESRRRDFAGLDRLPARLVGVGDAVASFNPVYGQGMTSAALHASCLSEYLRTGPDLQAPATGFFERQQAVVDAAWAISAGSDAARLDAQSGAAVPDEVRQQRDGMDLLMRAARDDADVSHALEDVMYMLAHPATLADPALIGRALAVNEASGGYQTTGHGVTSR